MRARAGAADALASVEQQAATLRRRMRDVHALMGPPEVRVPFMFDAQHLEALGREAHAALKQVDETLDAWLASAENLGCPSRTCQHEACIHDRQRALRGER